MLSGYLPGGRLCGTNAANASAVGPAAFAGGARIGGAAVIVGGGGGIVTGGGGGMVTGGGGMVTGGGGGLVTGGRVGGGGRFMPPPASYTLVAVPAPRLSGRWEAVPSSAAMQVPKRRLSGDPSRRRCRQKGVAWCGGQEGVVGRQKG